MKTIIKIIFALSFFTFIGGMLWMIYQADKDLIKIPCASIPLKEGETIGGCVHISN